ncbi:hypothetical protein D3C71_376760 [compost metagenome]
MPYKPKSMDNRRKARRNLERLMKEIETVPRSDNMGMEAISGVAKASQYFMRLENVIEVHIYSEGPERWYADLCFKDVPPGYSNVIGTPVKSPVRTHEEATDFAKAMLLMLRDSAPPEKRPDEIVFPFDSVDLTIPEEMYQHLVSLREEMKQDFSNEYITDLMERARTRIGGKITADRFNSAEQDDKIFVLMAATMCSLAGNIRWPNYVYDEETDRDSRGILYPEDMSEEDLKKTFPWRS